MVLALAAAAMTGAAGTANVTTVEEKPAIAKAKLMVSLGRKAVAAHTWFA